MNGTIPPPDPSRGITFPGTSCIDIIASLNDRARNVRGNTKRAYALAAKAALLVEKQDWMHDTALLSELGRSLLIRGQCLTQDLRYAEAQSLIRHAEELFTRLGDKPHLAEALHRLGVLALLTGDTHESLRTTGSSLELRREIGDRRGCCLSLSNLGMAYARLGDYEQALEYYNQSLELCRELGDEEGTGDTFLKMGAIALRQAEYDRARFFFEESLSIFEQLGLRKLEGFSLMNLGSISYFTGDYAVAFDLFRRSAVLFEEIGSRNNLALVFLNIGSVYRAVGEYSQALDHYYRTLAIFQEIGDQYNVALGYKNLAAIYREMNRHKRALEYTLKSLAMREEMDDKPGQAGSLFSIAGLYRDMHDNERALASAERSLELTRLVHDRRTEGEVLHLLGTIHAALGNDSEAGRFYTESLRCCEDTENRSGQVTTLIDTGLWYARRGLHDEGLALLNNALALAGDINSKPLLLDAHRGLADAFEQCGKTDEAFRHYKLYHELERALFSEESQRRMDTMQAIHEVEQMRQQAELHRLKTVELATANQRLHKLHEEKNEFLGVVVHNLQNPLTGILLTASLLQDRRENISLLEVATHARRIEDSARRMHEIIRKLLEINRIETGNYSFMPSAFDLRQCVNSILIEYERRARTKQIEIKIEQDGTSPVYADHAATAEVLDNLISNALKYSRPLTTITIRLVVRGTVVRCEIQDEGPGIKAEEQGRLFEKFSRLSARPTGGETSTGLGLSIVKRLVEAMNGEVWCESEPGKGSTFIVELPALQSEKTGKK